MAPTMFGMAQTFDICIRGGGIVGRTLALLLARDRLRVALVTRAAPLPVAPDVRAYAINNASRTLLTSLRSWPDAEHATAVTAMRVHGDDGGVVSFQASEQGTDALAWIVDVPALETQLSQAIRYQPLVELVDTAPAAPLTIICEGSASQTRSEFGTDVATTRYAQQAVAARVHCEQPHRGMARQWFLPSGVLAFLPLDGAQGHTVAVVWSTASAAVPELLALSPEEFCNRLATACAADSGALTLTSERAAWPLQRATASRWCGAMPDAAAGDLRNAAPSTARKNSGPRSWVLAGDAAHTVHPLAGQGLNLGLADAQALAAVLHERDYWRSVGDLRLLRRYERARKANVLAMGLTTDGLQQLFMRDDGPLQALRNWGMRGFDRSGPLKRWLAEQAMGGH